MRIAADDLNRLTEATVAGQTAKTFTYDLGGNITWKDGMGNYSDAPAAGSLQEGERAHPHAVRLINGVTALTYDKNGNTTGGLGRVLTWNSFNMPERIEKLGTDISSAFTCDVDRGRITHRAAKGGVATRTVYVGGMYEEMENGATLERKHYISSPAGRIAIYSSTTQVTSTGSQPAVGTVTFKTQYLHTDHLGSNDVVTDEQGVPTCRESFDAWGSRRATDWNPSTPVTFCESIKRGYTGHEQLDDLGLVHMNGRIYDPGLGRFLSADPTLQAPTETQNFNRYSYVLNNPLSLTDPSGFNFLNNFGKWLNKTLGSTGTDCDRGDRRRCRGRNRRSSA